MIITVLKYINVCLYIYICVSIYIYIYAYIYMDINDNLMKSLGIFHTYLGPMDGCNG